MTTASFFFPSCKQKTDYSKEIANLDSARATLMVTRKSVEKTIELDSNTITFISSNIEEIRSLQSSDTVDKQTGILLAKLSDLKGMLIDLKQYREHYLQATYESITRIKALEHDLKENLIDDNKAREYIVNETKTLEKILTELKLIKEVSSVSAGKLDSLRPMISLIADSLKAQ